MPVRSQRRSRPILFVLLAPAAVLMASCSPSQQPRATDEDLEPAHSSSASITSVPTAVRTAIEIAVSSNPTRGGCPSDGARRVASNRSSEAEVEVVRLVDDCLVTHFELVLDGDADHLLDTLAADSTILAVSLVHDHVQLYAEDAGWIPEAMGIPSPDPEGWPTGQGVTVAVIDSGIDVTHADLAGVEIEQQVDASRRAAEQIDVNDDASKGIWHGTHVAGIIAAQPNDIGSRGIAPDVALLDGNGGILRKGKNTAAQSISWAVEQGADVINFSFGFTADVDLSEYERAIAQQIERAFRGSITSTMRAKIIEAAALGVVLVAAGGNCDPDCPTSAPIPAAFDEVIAISFVDRKFEPRQSSLTGPHIDLAAPGVDVVSLIPGDSIDTKTGSSQAAPVVSATAALIIEELGGPRSKERAILVREVLESTAFGFGVEKDETFGYGILNIVGAVETARMLGSGDLEAPSTDAPPATVVQDSLRNAAELAVEFLDAALSSRGVDHLIAATVWDLGEGGELVRSDFDSTLLLASVAEIGGLAEPDAVLAPASSPPRNSFPASELGSGCGFVGDTGAVCDVTYKSDSRVHQLFQVFVTNVDGGWSATRVTWSKPAASSFDPGFWCVTGVAADDTLSVRTGPGVDNPKVGEAPAISCSVVISPGAQRAEINGGTWVEISYSDHTLTFDGWVNARYLSFYEPMPDCEADPDACGQ